MKVQLKSGQIVEIESIWEFIEYFMDDYSHDDRILHIDIHDRWIHEEEVDERDVKYYGFDKRDLADIHADRRDMEYEVILEAIMNVLKAYTPTEKVKMTVYFGAEICRAFDELSDGEELDMESDEYSYDDIRTFEFNTKAEADAFVQGLWAMDGYTDYRIVN